MRSTADLIEELRKEAATGNFRIVALAVGFEKSTQFVFNTDPNPLEKLNALVQQGGEPVGFVGFTSSGNEGRVATRPLQEYKGEQWAAEYLATPAASFGAQIEAANVGRVVSGKN